MPSLWKFTDLVTDKDTGRLRETGLWSNIGKLSMTFAFFYLTLHNTLSEWYVAAYGGIVVLHELGSRYLSNKQINNNGNGDGH